MDNLMKKFIFQLLAGLCVASGVHGADQKKMRHYTNHELATNILQYYASALDLELTRTNEHLACLKFKRVLTYLCCCSNNYRLNSDISYLEARRDIINGDMARRIDQQSQYH